MNGVSSYFKEAVLHGELCGTICGEIEHGGKSMKPEEEYRTLNSIDHYILHYPAGATMGSTNSTDDASPVSFSDSVVLFLHGGPGSEETLLAYKTVPKVPFCTFVFYDQRGTGKTQARNKTNRKHVTINYLIEDLRAMVQYTQKRYRPKNLLLLGHSWGSILGLEYIKRYAHTVTAYIGMGAVPNFIAGEIAGFEHCLNVVMQNGTRKSRKVLRKLQEYPQKLQALKNLPSFGNPMQMWVEAKKELKVITQLSMQLRILQTQYGYTAYKKENRGITLMRKSPQCRWRDFMSLLVPSGVNQMLGIYTLCYDTTPYTTFDIPIFFLCGRHDWQTPSTETEKYYHTIEAPQKHLYWIEDAAHLMDLDSPAAYHTALQDILSQLPAKYSVSN